MKALWHSSINFSRTILILFAKIFLYNFIKTTHKRYKTVFWNQSNERDICTSRKKVELVNLFDMNPHGTRADLGSSRIKP